MHVRGIPRVDRSGVSAQILPEILFEISAENFLALNIQYLGTLNKTDLIHSLTPYDMIRCSHSIPIICFYKFGCLRLGTFVETVEVVSSGTACPSAHSLLLSRWPY